MQQALIEEEGEEEKGKKKKRSAPLSLGQRLTVDEDDCQEVGAADKLRQLLDTHAHLSPRDCCLLKMAIVFAKILTHYMQ